MTDIPNSAVLSGRVMSRQYKVLLELRAESKFEFDVMLVYDSALE